MKSILSILIVLIFSASGWNQGPSSSSSDLLDYYKDLRSSLKHSSTKKFTEDEQGQMDKVEQTLKDNFPDSYEYNLVRWMNGNYSLDRKDNLLAAYKLRPDDRTVIDEMMAYYVITGDDAKQKLFAGKIKKNYSKNTLNFYRDMLPDDGVLITSGMQDSYPLYVLQLAYGEGGAVTVMNMDLMQNSTYKKRIQSKAGAGNASFLGNEKSYIRDIITQSKKDVVVATTVNQSYLSRVAENMYITGLVYEYEPSDQRADLERFWAKVKKRNLAEVSLNRSERRLYSNYLPALMTLYKIMELDQQQDNNLKAGIEALAAKINKSETVKKILIEYEEGR